jgi:HTH domain
VTGPSASPFGAVARHPLLAAVEPLVAAVGGELVDDPDGIAAGDIPLVWEGRTVGAFRRPPLHGALDRLIEQVERELGGALPELSREDKQEAVRRLEDRGAFLLRRSVEDVADALGVSRITVYNYLNAIR